MVKKKILNILNSKPVIGLMIFLILGISMVIAGDVIVKEGDITIDDLITGNKTYMGGTPFVDAGQLLYLEASHSDINGKVFDVQQTATTTTNGTNSFYGFLIQAERFVQDSAVADQGTSYGFRTDLYREETSNSVGTENGYLKAIYGQTLNLGHHLAGKSPATPSTGETTTLIGTSLLVRNDFGLLDITKGLHFGATEVGGTYDEVYWIWINNMPAFSGNGQKRYGFYMPYDMPDTTGYSGTQAFAIRTKKGVVQFDGDLQVGTGTADIVTINGTNGNLYVSNDLEVDGDIYYAGTLNNSDIVEYMDTIYSEGMRECSEVTREEETCFDKIEGEEVTEECKIDEYKNIECELEESYVAEFSDGDVVCADVDNPGYIKECSEKGDLSVIGWVNHDASMFLEAKKIGAYPIVLTGLADVKVKNCDSYPISPGDLLIVAGGDTTAGRKFPIEYLEEQINSALASDDLETYTEHMLNMIKYEGAKFAKALGSCDLGTDSETMKILAIDAR